MVYLTEYNPKWTCELVFDLICMLLVFQTNESDWLCFYKHASVSFNNSAEIIQTLDILSGGK